jgi:hypothetical protein
MCNRNIIKLFCEREKEVPSMLFIQESKLTADKHLLSRVTQEREGDM